jgi:hypothetical protein
MEFVGNIARKTGDPSLLAVEAAKSRLAREIGQETGLFYVPEVIRFDAKAGVLDFERLEGLVTLLQLAVRKDERVGELMKKVGQALAMVHEKLVLPEEMKHVLPEEWMDTSGLNVFIHGDFAMCNLSFHETSGQLVIVDWSGAPLIGRTPTFGTRFFDILWFASSIFHNMPVKRTLDLDFEKMADAFFTGYAAASSLDRLSKLLTYIPAIRRLHKRNTRYLVRRQSLLPRRLVYALCQTLMYVRFCRFLRRYEQEKRLSEKYQFA